MKSCHNCNNLISPSKVRILERPRTLSRLITIHDDHSARSSRLLVKFATTLPFNCTVACACTGNVAHPHVRTNAARRQPFLLPVGCHAQNAYAYADWRPCYAPHIPTRDRFEPVPFSFEMNRSEKYSNSLAAEVETDSPNCPLDLQLRQSIPLSECSPFEMHPAN